VFWVTAASVVPLSYFPTADEMRGQLTLAADANRRSGMAGALFVVLVDTGSGITNVVPVGFPEGPDNLDVGGVFEEEAQCGLVL
jgi:hypothetical protein